VQFGEVDLLDVVEVAGRATEAGTLRQDAVWWATIASSTASSCRSNSSAMLTSCASVGRYRPIQAIARASSRNACRASAIDAGVRTLRPSR
jgi:hypothetical protein